MKIKELPPILIIHLKRFRSIPNTPTTKIYDSVDYPFENLNLSRYTSDPSLPMNKQTYRLFSMINHTGRANFGHYTNIVFSKNPEGWFKCDDDDVRPVS